MKVKELISRLLDFPMDREIFIGMYEGNGIKNPNPYTGWCVEDVQYFSESSNESPIEIINGKCVAG